MSTTSFKEMARDKWNLSLNFSGEVTNQQAADELNNWPEDLG